MSRELLDLDALEIHKVSCTYRECMNPAVAMVFDEDEDEDEKDMVGFLCHRCLTLMKEHPSTWTRVGFEFRERYADELEEER